MGENWKPTIDLAGKAVHHLEFLKSVQNIQQLDEDVHIDNAVRRYELLWLPLLGQNRNHKKLDPPLDVHWIWHCHMLAPKAYKSDCMKAIGFVPDHEVRIIERYVSAKNLWAAMYPSEAFNIDFNSASNLKPPKYTSDFEYDLPGASKRQRLFYYNVSLPHYKDAVFLRTALKRYLQFLRLKRDNRDAFLVPMYDIDLIWHTHQLYPHHYDRDTTNLLGYILNHDDEMTDRGPGSKLATSFTESCALWKSAYGEHYSIPGTLCRGESPAKRLDPARDIEILGQAPFGASFKIQRLTLSGGKEKYKVDGTISAGNTYSNVSDVYLPTVKGSPLIWASSTGIMTVPIHVLRRPQVTLDLNRHDGLDAFFVKKPFTKITFNVNQCLEGLTAYAETQTRTILAESTAVGGVRYKLEVQGTLFELYRDRVTLKLKCGKFNDYVIPENIEQLWGPIHFPRLPEGVPNVCRGASHNVTSGADKLLTVRVIHSLPLRKSVIQIYNKAKIVMTSEVIGPEQLPSELQLIKCHDFGATLNAAKGARAMLMKDSNGDYGIITGQWKDFCRPSASKRGKKGYLQLWVSSLTDQFASFPLSLLHSARPTRITTIQDEQIHFNNSVKLNILGENGIRVNMANGVITVGSYCKNLPGMIAIAFSAAVLVLLCEPQPHVFLNKGEPAEPPAKHGVKSQFTSHSASFIKNCGYMEAKYSNSWRYWYWCSHRHHAGFIEEFEYDTYGSAAAGGGGGGSGGGGGGGDGCEENVGGGEEEENVGDGEEEENVGGGEEEDAEAAGIYCPWDPDNTTDHSNDVQIAETGVCDDHRGGGDCDDQLGGGDCDVGGGGGDGGGGGVDSSDGGGADYSAICGGCGSCTTSSGGGGGGGSACASSSDGGGGSACVSSSGGDGGSACASSSGGGGGCGSSCGGGDDGGGGGDDGGGGGGDD